MSRLKNAAESRAAATDWLRSEGLADAHSAAAGLAPRADIANQAPAVTIADGPGVTPDGAIAQITPSPLGEPASVGAIQLRDGGVIAAWRGYNGTAFDYYAQRYDETGDPVGGALTLPPGQIIELTDGSFVAVREDDDADDTGVFAQRYDAAFNPLAPQFQVNTTTSNFQDSPGAAALEGGGFMIAWESSDGSSNGIWGQRYDALGNAAGTQFRLNSLTAFNQLIPQVVATPDGGFFAVWVTVQAFANGSTDVWARRFDASGNALGGDIAVNSYTVGAQSFPGVAMLEAGRSVVIWDGPGPDGSGGIWGQLFDADGVKIGGNFRISARDGVFRQASDVEALPGGGFIVTWDANAGVPGDVGIFARSFDAAAHPIGPEFRVNHPDTHGSGPNVAVFGDGIVRFFWTHDSIVYSQGYDPAHHATEQIGLDLKNVVAIADPDPDAGAGSVTVTLTVDYGILTVGAGTSGAAVSGSGTAAVTVTGTLAQVQALLGGDPASVVQYVATGDNPPATAALGVTVSDGALSAQATEAIHLTGVNDAPVNAVGGDANGPSDQAFALTGVSIADPDGSTGEMTVHFGVAHGILNIRTDVAGGIIAADITGGGQGTNGLTLTATPAQINATLAASNGLLYQADAGFIGADALGVDSHEGLRTDTVSVAGLNAFDTAQTPVDFATGDLNGDGRLDLVVANQGAGTVTVLLGNGDGTFAPQVAYSTGSSNSVALVSLNSDQDNFLDIVVANGNGTIGVLRGNGNGTFQAQTTTAVSSAFQLVSADFNGDGRADVAFTRASTGVQVLFGTGTGTFSGGAVYSAGTEQGHAYTTREVDKGDYNGDGFVDLIVASDTNANVTSSGSISLLLGSANGTFAAPLIVASTGGPKRVVAADVNGDGNLDFVTRESTATTVTVYLGDGSGGFGGGTPYTLATGSGSFVVTDINGDGRPDIAVGTDGASPTTIGALQTLVGNGDGTFQPAATLFMFGNNFRAVGGADFDGDGDTDLVFGDQLNYNLRILLNRTAALGDFDTKAIHVAAAPIIGTEGPDTLIGTGHNELIEGLGGDDSLDGLGGNDTLDGGTGADSMTGGAGNDTYVVDNGADTAHEAAGGGFDQVYATASFALAAGSEIEVLAAADSASTAALNFIGNAFGQTIFGNAGANVLTGGGGADALHGRGGDDIYSADVLDVIVEAAGEGFDQVYSLNSFTLNAGAEVEVIATGNSASNAALSLIGNEYGQSIIGNAGANTLVGGGGADGLYGLGGDDIYSADVQDVVVEHAGEGFDQVYSVNSFTLNAGAEVEVIATGDSASTAALNLYGNEYGQQIIGNAGANTLVGGGGADGLYGLGGDDIYSADGNDVVAENAGQGFDQVYSLSSFTLSNGVEVEVIAAGDSASTTALNLTGNAFAQQIFGNAGANILDGGGGADALYGLGGADTFAFTSALGGGNVDTIADFSAADDMIALENEVFTGLPAGALDPNAFVVGAAAVDAGDRIVYNQATGQLFFDADGNGGGAQVQFALLNGTPVITASDFTVI